MKPCFKHRKNISALALGVLDARSARDLNLHLKNCEGCRSCFQELSGITSHLGAAQIAPEREPSAGFHQRLASRLRVASREKRRVKSLASFLTVVGWWFSRVTAQRPVLLPVAGAAGILMGFALLHTRTDPQTASTPQTAAKTAHIPSASLPAAREFPPTFSSYRAVANRSLDKLDALLLREGTRAFSPAPLYTASSLSETLRQD